MRFIKAYKQEIYKILTILFLSLAFFIYVKIQIDKMPFWENEQNAKVLLLMLAFLLLICRVYVNMKKNSNFYELLYKFLPPVLIVCGFIEMDFSVKYMPLLIPVVYFAIVYEALESFIFVFFVGILYYNLEFLNVDILWMFALFSIFVLCIHEYVKNRNVHVIFSLLMVIIGYLSINGIYQYMLYEKIKVNQLLIGVIPMVVSVFPLFIKDVIVDIKKIYLKKSIDSINNDENELLMILMDKNQEAYIHSLNVADISVNVAKKMSANVELVKAGARFHEIGKIKGDNYISKGIEILRENKYPSEIINIVKEHNSKSNKPENIESAIVMLTDSIETTLENVAKSKGERFPKVNVVRNVIDIRFDDGMLDYAIKDIKEYQKLRKIYMDIYS